jgi:hypothetical protein
MEKKFAVQYWREKSKRQQTMIEQLEKDLRVMKDSIDRGGLAKRLAPKYRSSPTEIADLCDNFIDPTGRLLGYIRNEVRGYNLTDYEKKLLKHLCGIVDWEMSWGAAMSEALNHLRILGFVEPKEDNGIVFYSITDKGREAAK